MKHKLLFSFIIICITLCIFQIYYYYEETKIDYTVYSKSHLVAINNFQEDYNEYLKLNYFNGESIEDIANKLNKYLNSSLKGKGEFITQYSLEKGVDPYLVTSVILLETGCQWTCSYLARVCNNYGGNKGNPGCNGGSYKKFSTQEEGLKFAINKLANYYNKGLNTPEKIGPKYATSKTWASKVNKYMNKLMD